MGPEIEYCTEAETCNFNNNYVGFDLVGKLLKIIAGSTVHKIVSRIKPKCEDTKLNYHYIDYKR